jgi:hypothetical protein
MEEQEMSKSLQEVKQGIVVTSSGLYCQAHTQHYGPAYNVKITTIKSSDDGWIAKGGGKQVYMRCMMVGCSDMAESIMHAIPIQCAAFPCTTCGQTQNLKYEIRSIEANKSAFEFEVSIICGKCSKKRSIKKMLKKLLEIIKIEVKPTGITIKNA